jgi:hypothetical protein
MAFLVCPRAIPAAVIYCLIRLPEYLNTFSPKLRDILEGGFIDSLLID